MVSKYCLFFEGAPDLMPPQWMQKCVGFFVPPWLQFSGIYEFNDFSVCRGLILEEHVTKSVSDLLAFDVCCRRFRCSFGIMDRPWMILWTFRFFRFPDTSSTPYGTPSAQFNLKIWSLSLTAHSVARKRSRFGVYGEQKMTDWLKQQKYIPDTVWWNLIEFRKKHSNPTERMLCSFWITSKWCYIEQKLVLSWISGNSLTKWFSDNFT